MKVLPALFLIAAALPFTSQATPIDYAINFTLGSQSPIPTSGSFTYDPTTDLFSNFIVVWNGLSFNLTASANSPTIGNPDPGCTGEGNSGFGYILMSEAVIGCSIYEWTGAIVSGQGALFEFAVSTLAGTDYLRARVGSTAASDVADGSWTISEASLAAPEPRTLVLLLLGIACALSRAKLKPRPNDPKRASILAMHL